MVQYIVTVQVTLDADSPGEAVAAVEMALVLGNLNNVQGTKFSVEQGHVPMDKLSDQQILNFKLRVGRLHSQIQRTWIMGAQPQPASLVLMDKKFKELFCELERRGYDAMDSSIEQKLVKKVA